MKKIILGISLCSLIVNVFSQSTEEMWLVNNFHEVSTDAKNKDYSDLQFLKEDLKDQKIIAIGEQMHLDGKTFEARSRLIEFLIKEMGFEVLIFESGIYDVKYGWSSYLSSDSIKDLTNSIMHEWRNNIQNEELFSFIASWQKNEKNIECDGFDCKFTSRYRKHYSNELDSILIQINPTIKNDPDYIFYHNFLDEFGEAKAIKAAIPDLSKKDVALFIKGSELVLKTLMSVNHPFLQTAKSMDKGIVKYSELSIWKLLFNKKTLIKLNNERDVLMAEALNYLIEDKYKNKKVILFGATYHFIRNNQDLKTIKKARVPIPESIIMGDLMNREYNKKIYTIGFAAYSGTYGILKPRSTKGGTKITPAENGSLEKILHDENRGDGLLILSNNHKKPNWWFNNISIRLFSYNSTNTCTDWSNVLDAVFYIDQMDPVFKK